MKDVIIAGGRNIYPQEVEEAVGALAGVRRGCVAAFGVGDAGSGTERLVVVAETREGESAVTSAIREAVIGCVVDAIGMPPDVVILSRPGCIPKTSSGKIRRNSTRELYLQGALERGSTSAAAQWARLVARDVAWRGSAAVRGARLRLFTMWAWTAMAVLVPFLWIGLALSRDRAAARRVIAAAARLVLRLGRCTVDVAGRGRDGLAADHPAVIVANHASYLDVVVLLSLLPVGVRFAAKARLASYPVLGLLLRRAAYLLVRRGSAPVAQDLAATLREGESLCMFPEGTFRRAPGIMPFRLGAFQAAVETGRPVVPVALAGTRAIWPDGTLLLRPGRVTVTVGEPIVASGAGWPAIVQARDAARTTIAAHAGEAPVDVGHVVTDAPAPTDPRGGNPRSEG
jgi:1-acyl-sn-glycerol-3-phosphate acyltransferase